MNERLTIRLTEGGRRLPINSLGNDGVMLRDETDATPRGLLLEFDGDTPATKFRMERVRTLRGWNQHEFKLDLHLAGGDLVITGVDSRALPAGRYWYRLRIADLDVDLGNPLQDVAGFVVHLGELIYPGKTDHLALGEKLAKNKTVAKFLYYEVVKNS